MRVGRRELPLRGPCRNAAGFIGLSGRASARVTLQCMGDPAEPLFNDPVDCNLLTLSKELRPGWARSCSARSGRPRPRGCGTRGKREFRRVCGHTWRIGFLSAWSAVSRADEARELAAIGEDGRLRLRSFVAGTGTKCHDFINSLSGAAASPGVSARRKMGTQCAVDRRQGSAVAGKGNKP